MGVCKGGRIWLIYRSKNRYRVCLCWWRFCHGKNKLNIKKAEKYEEIHNCRGYIKFEKFWNTQNTFDKQIFNDSYLYYNCTQSNKKLTIRFGYKLNYKVSISKLSIVICGQILKLSPINKLSGEYFGLN